MEFLDAKANYAEVDIQLLRQTTWQQSNKPQAMKRRPTRRNPEPFRYLALPLELRNEVYSYACNCDLVEKYDTMLIDGADRMQANHTSSRSREIKTATALLLVNRQIRSEALYVLARLPLRLSQWSDNFRSDKMRVLLTSPLLQLARVVEMDIPIESKDLYWRRMFRIVLSAVVLEKSECKHQKLYLRFVQSTKPKLIDLKDPATVKKLYKLCTSFTEVQPWEDSYEFSTYRNDFLSNVKKALEEGEL